MRISQIFRLFLSWILIAQASAPAYADNINLPDLGDESLAAMSISQEKRLGAEFMRQARNAGVLTDDPELNSYLQSLGQRLLAQADVSYRDFHFFMVDDKEINAFAVPGGYVGVNKGLVLATRSEAELASVLAHEITHVTQRHVPRLMVAADRTGLPMMAAVLAAILLGGTQGASAGIALSTAAVAQREINFTRTFEEEADRLGMGLLARAGFDPSAMPSFFEHMQTLNRINDIDLPEFLRSHPVTSNRIAEARARADQLPARESHDSVDYLQVHAKLRALAPDDAAETSREFAQNLEQGRYRDADAERYGYAVSLLRQRDLPHARAEAEKLVNRKPDRLPYRILQARVEMEAQQTKTALEMFARTYKRAPENTALTRYYAEALLEAKETQRAYELLKAAVRKTTDDANLFRLLAQAAGNSGHDADAHRAQAEYYYLNGNFPAAIEQYERVLRMVCADYYQRAGIQARIAELRDEMAIFMNQDIKAESAKPTPHPDDCAQTPGKAHAGTEKNIAPPARP